MLQVLTDFLETNFEKDLFQEVIKNLNCKDSKIRHCNFAYSLRAILDYIFEKRLSPDEEVKKASWYLKESKERDVTRRQRYKYFIQGCIDDYFIDEMLKFENINEITKNLNEKVFSLSKFTHINEIVFYASDDEVNNFVEEIEQALIEFFEELENIKETLLHRLEDWLFYVVNDEFISETISEVDILCTHYYVDFASVESIEIFNPNNKSIFLDLTKGFNVNVKGTLYVEHQFGSSKDVEKGDGLLFNENYPYNMELFILIPTLKDLIDDEEAYNEIKNYTKEEKEELNEAFLKVIYNNIKKINHCIDTSSYYE